MRLYFLIMGWFGRLIGVKALWRYLEWNVRFSLPLCGALPQLRSMFGRILNFERRTPADAAEIDRVIAHMLSLHALNMAVVFTFDARKIPEYLRQTESRIEPVLRKLQAGGKGVILANHHFGSMVIGVLAAAQVMPVTTLLMNAPLFESPARGTGVKVVGLRSAAVDCSKALANNEAVWLDTDLDYFPDNRTADFFGAPVRPPHGPARLSLLTGAPILSIFPLWSQGRYYVLGDDPIFPEGKTQEQIESAILRSMERAIKQYPEHWWVGRDVWDLERTDRTNRLQLKMVGLENRFSSLNPF